MLFSSSVFLFLFLPLFFLGYFALRSVQWKNLLLFLASLFFYTWGEGEIVLVMLASTVVDFTCGRLIERGRRKLGLWASIFFNLGLLAYFKYANFAFENYNAIAEAFGLSDSALIQLPYIALPIGISFYTFQTMSYTIDVYRGTVKANQNFVSFAAYVTMFPQLVAGPIIRYVDIAKQLEKRHVNWNDLGLGTERFIIGLAKKVLLANTFASVADQVFTAPAAHLSASAAWLGIICYSFQIYYDFSGYSDMAIGLGRMLGFRFLENFNYPYIAKSIQEFWRRWHISLSFWFRDYLYISLGGNRVGKIRLYFNLLLVFLVTGLWHGASWNFVFWGLFHGAFLILERLGLAGALIKTPRVVAHAYTLLVVVVGWVFFRSPDMSYALEYVSVMFGLNTGAPPIVYADGFLSYDLLLWGIPALLFSMPVFIPSLRYLEEVWSRYVNAPPWLTGVLSALCFLSLFLASVAYIAADSYNPFIYFRF